MPLIVALWLRNFIQVIDLLNLTHFHGLVAKHRSASTASLYLIQSVSIILSLTYCT